MSGQNKVEQVFAGLPYQVDGLGLNHGNDAGFSTCNPSLSKEKLNHGIDTGFSIYKESAQLFKEMSEGGVKHDQGKPDLSHISLTLMEEVARVREFGAKKYSRGNWLKGFKYTRSIAAALRHIMAFKEGEDLDPESGLSHISHSICCLEHLLNDIKNHKENDDR